MKPRGFALRWACDPCQGQGQWKWYKIEVNGDYNYKSMAGMKKIGWKV